MKQTSQDSSNSLSKILSPKGAWLSENSRVQTKCCCKHRRAGRRVPALPTRTHSRSHSTMLTRSMKTSRAARGFSAQMRFNKTMAQFFISVFALLDAKVVLKHSAIADRNSVEVVITSNKWGTSDDITRNSIKWILSAELTGAFFKSSDIADNFCDIADTREQLSTAGLIALVNKKIVDAADSADPAGRRERTLSAHSGTRMSWKTGGYFLFAVGSTNDPIVPVGLLPRMSETFLWGYTASLECIVGNSHLRHAKQRGYRWWLNLAGLLRSSDRIPPCSGAKLSPMYWWRGRCCKYMSIIPEDLSMHPQRTLPKPCRGYLRRCPPLFETPPQPCQVLTTEWTTHDTELKCKRKEWDTSWQCKRHVR